MALTNTPPASAEEAIREFEKYRAEREKRQDQTTTEAITIRVSPYTLEFTTSVPLNESTDKQIETLLKKLEVHLDSFRGKYQLSTRSEKRLEGPKTEPPKPLLPYGINQIEWWPNKFPENVPAEKRGEYARGDQPEATELRKTLENIGKPIEIQGQSYSLNAARTYIYRKPVEATK